MEIAKLRPPGLTRQREGAAAGAPLMAPTPVVERHGRHEQAGIPITQLTAHVAELGPVLMAVALAIRGMLGEEGQASGIDAEEGDILRWRIGVENGPQRQTDSLPIADHRRPTGVHAQQARLRSLPQLGDPIVVRAPLRDPIHTGSSEHQRVEEGHGQRA